MTLHSGDTISDKLDAALSCADSIVRVDADTLGQMRSQHNLLKVQREEAQRLKLVERVKQLDDQLSDLQNRISTREKSMAASVSRMASEVLGKSKLDAALACADSIISNKFLTPMASAGKIKLVE